MNKSSILSACAATKLGQNSPRTCIGCAPVVILLSYSGRQAFAHTAEAIIFISFTEKENRQKNWGSDSEKGKSETLAVSFSNLIEL